MCAKFALMWSAEFTYSRMRITIPRREGARNLRSPLTQQLMSIMEQDKDRQEWQQDQKAQQEYKEWCLKEDLRQAGLSVEEVLKVTEKFFSKEQK